MLYFPQTSIEISRERPVALGSQITAEGAALVAATVGGQFGVKQSTGGAGEVFQGVSINSVTGLTQVPFIESAVPGSDNAIVLHAEPLGGTVRVFRKDTGAALASAATADATHYAVDAGNPKKFLFDASLAAVEIQVVYSYAPTLAQAVALQGNVLPGGPAGQYLGQVGVVTRGDVYTDQWDTAADWSNPVGVKLGANGKFTSTTVAAEALRGVTIIELPTAARSYLGLSINAAV